MKASLASAIVLISRNLCLASLFFCSTSTSSLTCLPLFKRFEPARHDCTGIRRQNSMLGGKVPEIRPLRIRGGAEEDEEEMMGACGNYSSELPSEAEELTLPDSQSPNITTFELSTLERSQSAGFRSTELQPEGGEFSRDDDDVRGESSSSEMVDEDGMPYNTNYTDLNEDRGNECEYPRGCRHYSRGCRLRAPCCNELFWCRHCHNEVKDVACKDPLKSHQLDRSSVKLVCCSRCELEQTAKQYCEGCGLCFGKYYCDICKFFDDDLSKGVFHCNDCGICRIGGSENFFHCQNCGESGGGRRED
eukprot:323741-Hanusia_phi.AAC.1